MLHSEAVSSGESGQLKHPNRLAPNFIVNLQVDPVIPQKVKFFDARVTFIAEELPIERMEAIKFDEWIARFFKDIQGINREQWELADRLWAINSILSQQQHRREKGQPYLRRDELPEYNGFLLTAVFP